jgi:hypothetical protein
VSQYAILQSILCALYDGAILQPQHPPHTVRDLLLIKERVQGKNRRTHEGAGYYSEPALCLAQIRARPLGYAILQSILCALYDGAILQPQHPPHTVRDLLLIMR